jgi:hypothetical protein
VTKQEDDKAFKAQWILFGMHWKKRGDAHGIEWRGKSFDDYRAQIIEKEKWATPDEYKGESQDA